MIVASSLDWGPLCREVMAKALRNEPMKPEVYRFAFYLYGRLKLVRSAAVRILKSAGEKDDVRTSKRTGDQASMEANRCIFVPLQFSTEPSDVEVRQCDVMMVDDGQLEAFFALNPEAAWSCHT